MCLSITANVLLHNTASADNQFKKKKYKQKDKMVKTVLKKAKKKQQCTSNATDTAQVRNILDNIKKV